ncbi:zinc-ribbon domain-containing protein [Loktanella sp. TSTF-M6]|uniref:Zinc-ribbon domain-containing protein n=1 Tax=Loktanella gaetbuli TaxID=2881335 RepID=A0ABS8BVV4_9RHOB|nr:zinc-ribbon domain-containing protein [Loktanella gaetbuli]MCB5199871.1 zinc-ribbon domain-containing protein [Loktanella gaetbuli]
MATIRLICPNCGATYEVDADVIPAGGRDVQCSNCAHTWFESTDAPSDAAESMGAVEPPRAPEPREADPDPMDDPFAADDDGNAPDDDADMQDDPADAATDDNSVVVDDAPAVPPQAQDVPAAAAAPAQRRPLEASIAEILREEAAHEEAARKAEAGDPFAGQADMALRDPEPQPAAVKPRRPLPPEDEGRERLARLKGETPSPVSKSAIRREQFPDIEEINSTLRSDAERDPLGPIPTEQAENDRKSGRAGFLTVIGLILIAVAIYTLADTIAATVPALADPLAAYVAAVDAGRLWLDNQVQALVRAMGGDI